MHKLLCTVGNWRENNLREHSVAGALGEPLGTAGEEGQGETCTFGPVTLEHPFAFGPFAQPHQLFVASTVPFFEICKPYSIPVQIVLIGFNRAGRVDDNVIRLILDNILTHEITVPVTAPALKIFMPVGPGCCRIRRICAITRDVIACNHVVVEVFRGRCARAS